MTRMAMFSAKAYDHRSFDAANVDRGVDIEYHESRLDASTAGYAAGAHVVCGFVNDDLSARVLEALAEHGVGIIAMRCAGYNNVDRRCRGSSRNHRRAGPRRTRPTRWRSTRSR